jgi:hypothetical protein
MKEKHLFLLNFYSGLKMIGQLGINFKEDTGEFFMKAIGLIGGMPEIGLLVNKRIQKFLYSIQQKYMQLNQLIKH